MTSTGLFALTLLGEIFLMFLVLIDKLFNHHEHGGWMHWLTTIGFIGGSVLATYAIVIQGGFVDAAVTGNILASLVIVIIGTAIIFGMLQPERKRFWVIFLFIILWVITIALAIWAY